MALKEKLRVMVVDDLSASRALVYNCFDMMGVKNLMAAKNGADALDVLQKTPVHIVISDYNMPGMDGLQLLKALRSNPRTAKIGFILVTGSKDKAVIDQGRALGMNNYLTKPFNPRDLEKCVERVVGKLD